ncbi:MAG: M20 family peptidase [bacterium]|nr:M20/M25/M40 family metallo-hydrolase [Gammaproteobacteria bacterium]
MKRILGMIGLALAILALVVLINTLNLGTTTQALVDDVTVDLSRDDIPERLAAALRIKTISHQDTADNDYAALLALHDYMDEEFPLVRQQLNKQVVNEYSLLYRWQGSDPELKPVILMSHMDVVPVIEGTQDQWEHPPFAGTIDAGFIWGRGSMDDKFSVFCILEAIEHLLMTGFQPERTYYLAFGHDEETGGAEGANKIAELLKQQNVTALYAIDEGGFILDGMFSKPIAMINISEKGFLSLQLSVKGSGGHSSAPAAETAVGILSHAVANVSDNKFPIDTSTLSNMGSALAGELPFYQKAIAANLWLLKPLLTAFAELEPGLNAMIRTTTAPTMLSGSPKDNVLPILATAVVNHRIMPGETIETTIAFVTDVIDDDRVSIEILGTSSNPSDISSSTGPAFKTISKSIYQIARNDPVIMPGMLPAGTDTKHYRHVADDTYRFVYSTSQLGDTSRIHGTNERVSIDSYLDSIRFFIQLIRNSDEIR